MVGIGKAYTVTPLGNLRKTRQAYVENGYLQKVVSDKQLPNNIWYFPHLPVVSVDKTTMIQVQINCV